MIFEDAPAAPKPTPGGFRIFEDNSDAPPKPTPALRGPRVAIFEDAAAAPAEAAPRGRVAFAVEEEISFEERRTRVGPQDDRRDQAQTARRAFGELNPPAVGDGNMKPEHSSRRRQAGAPDARRAEEDLTINRDRSRDGSRWLAGFSRRTARPSSGTGR